MDCTRQCFIEMLRYLATMGEMKNFPIVPLCLRPLMSICSCIVRDRPPHSSCPGTTLSLFVPLYPRIVTIIRTLSPCLFRSIHASWPSSVPSLPVCSALSTYRGHHPYPLSLFVPLYPRIVTIIRTLSPCDLVSKIRHANVVPERDLFLSSSPYILRLSWNGFVSGGVRLCRRYM